MGRSKKLRNIDPTVDCVFKKLLGSVENKALTLDFLNAMVGLAGTAKFSDLVIMDPHLHKQFQENKRPVVDLLVIVNTGAVTQVEVQATVTRELAKRFVFDWSKLLAGGLDEGDSYGELRGAISIWILRENLFPRDVTEEVILKFRITCPEAEITLEPDSYILVVQLNNWKGHGTLDPGAERWIMLFREGKNIDLNHPPKCLDDEVMRMALEVMKNFTEDRLEYYRYEQELKQRRVNEWQDAAVQRRLDEANRARDKERRAKERERRAKERERAAKVKERAAKVKERAAKVKERAAKVKERAAKEQERAAKLQERTAKEQERAAKVQERTAKEQERAAKVQERAAREAAEAELLQLSLEVKRLQKALAEKSHPGDDSA